MPYFRVTSEGATGLRTRVTDLETGQDIRGIAAVTVTIPSPDDIVMADVQLAGVEVSAEAQGRFLVADPSTGEMKAVERIVFADGTEFVAAEPKAPVVKTLGGQTLRARG